MSGLLFRDAQPARTESPNRADVVCFIGFVGRRLTSPLPSRLKTWLHEQGWRVRGSVISDDDPLLNVPVPVDSFEAFDRLFTWETRPPQPHAFPFTTWLGAAVRSFFRQGGARCFVVRVGDPGPYALLAENATDAEKTAHLITQTGRRGLLFPGFAGSALAPASRQDPSTWKGLGVLLGLDEAAFVCLPDLPELFADAALEPAGLAPLPPSPEVFVECSPTVKLEPDGIRQISATPACTEAGLLEWRRAVRHATRFIRSERRDVQMLLALPFPARTVGGRPTQLLDEPTNVFGLGKTLDESDGIASAFLQLCHPWLATSGAEALPGGVEPPDGVYAGALARAIPERGVAHSIGRRALHGVHGFEPELSAADRILDTAEGDSPALIHRVSLIGQSADGVRILSDVTTSLAESHRPACIGRLTAALLRTARRIGEASTFEPSGEQLAESIRSQLDRLLSDFFAAGALQGESAAEAYSIRCDDTTTSQNDRDNGRVIAEVRFSPAHPVGLIVVVLSVREGAVSALDVLT